MTLRAILLLLADILFKSDVGIIYLQLGVELLIFEFEASQSAGWFSVVVAILFALAVYFLERTARLPFGRKFPSSFFLS